MDRNTFGRLCRILRDRVGLIDQKFVTVEEQVSMFLCVLSHHTKARIVGFRFMRSSQTVSKYIHTVLRGVLTLHNLFLAKPTPIDEACSDRRWNWFQGCLGALDGTYINVRVPVADAPRYRNRKGQITTNALAVCDPHLRFTYLLQGWEGSAGDSRILREAVSRPLGLKVPKGCYYLCDNAYANAEGFMTPYKGVHYHLKEWGPGRQAPNPGRAVQLETHKGPKCHRTIVCGAEDAMGYTPICKFLPDRCSNRLDHSMLPTTQLHQR
ncbi:protein ALP1-like [Salvia hispanica]|uniref:protein ALP1-like n=1 Tax=Salvia hispanica TaxID=49212 RepID=UPI002009B43A|nr:protein ALP1-like [Salvia hispanica]